MSLNIAMLIISLIDNKYFNEYVSYIISSSFISMIMIIIPLFNFVFWSSLSAFASGVIIILIMIILFNKDFLVSIKKIFHT